MDGSISRETVVNFGTDATDCRQTLSATCKLGGGSAHAVTSTSCQRMLGMVSSVPLPRGPAMLPATWKGTVAPLSIMLPQLNGQSFTALAWTGETTAFPPPVITVSPSGRTVGSFDETFVPARCFTAFARTSAHTGDEATVAGFRPPRRQEEPSRPTHFLALRITNPKIHEEVQRVQQVLIDGDPGLKKHLEDHRKLHLTLTVLRLDGRAQQERAVSVLREAVESDEVKRLLNKPVSLRFTGLDSFGTRVLFCKPEGEHHSTIVDLARSLRKRFEAEGLAAGTPTFELHATIAKIRAFGGGRGQKRLAIKKELWSHLEWSLQDDHQTQHFEAVELLAMMGPKADDGFYRSLCRVAWTQEIIVDLTKDEAVEEVVLVGSEAVEKDEVIVIE